MTRAPYKAPSIELGRKASRSELAHAALASAVEQMRRNTQGARRDRDPGFVHQLRVGARRARVVVRLFEKPIGKARARALARDLKWIFQLLGALRDRDVLLTDVIDPLTRDESEPALSLLAAELARERSQAQQRVKRALKGKRYAKLALALHEAELELSERRDDRRARKWAKKRLDARLASVMAKREAALGPDEVTRHELRKELKKLRYAAELVRSLWGKKKVKHYMDRMEALTDALGALNDVAAGRALLPVAAAHAETDTTAAIELCERALLARLTEHAPALETTFTDFATATPFWR